MGSLFDFIEEPAARQQTDFLSLPHTYSLITTAREAADAAASSVNADKTAIALNTVGDNAMTAALEGIAICHSISSASYVALPADKDARREIVSALQPLFSNARLIVGHDIKTRHNSPCEERASR